MVSDPGRSAPDRFDAVLIGSGINSLVAGATLAKAGWSVGVFEREQHLGGAIHTAPIGDPRFRHEHYSQTHTQFTTSPAYAYLREDLDAHGLRYLHCSTPTAVITSEGATLTLHQDAATNIAAFEDCATGDGDAYASALGKFWDREAPFAFGLQSVDVPSIPAAFLLASLRRKTGGVAGVGGWADSVTGDARGWLSDTFQSPLVRALFAPWSEHLGIGPEAPMSGFASRALIFMQEAGGASMPMGGGSALVHALVAIIEGNGGQALTNAEVEEVLVHRGKAAGIKLADGETVAATRAVLANVAPEQLYGRLLASTRVDPALTAGVNRRRDGLSGMQVMFSLKTPPAWNSGITAGEVSLINFTDGVDAVSRAYNEAQRGLLPARPTLAVGQPMAVDPDRGPDGSWMLWVQLLEVPAKPNGDAASEIDTANGWTEETRESYADRVQAMVAEHWVGFDEAVLERRALSPVDLEQKNINLVHGAIHGGESTLTGLFLGRPFPGRASHRTPIKGLWHIGAFTRPGAGLGARSGFKVAQYLSAPRGPRGIGARLNAGRD